MSLILGLLWWEIGILVIASFICVAAIINEADWLAIISFIAGIGFYQWLLKLDIWNWFLLNYKIILIYSICYFIFGVVWSIFKWYRFLKEKFKTYQEKKAQFLIEHKIKGKEIPLELKEKWAHLLYRTNVWPISPNDHKSKIMRWIIYWPISVVWAMTQDFFVWVGKKLYELFGNLYKKIAEKVFAEVIEEINKKEEE